MGGWGDRKGRTEGNEEQEEDEHPAPAGLWRWDHSEPGRGSCCPPSSPASAGRDKLCPSPRPAGRLRPRQRLKHQWRCLTSSKTQWWFQFLPFCCTWSVSFLLLDLRLSVLRDAHPLWGPGQESSQRLPVWGRALPANLAHDDVQGGPSLAPGPLWPMKKQDPEYLNTFTDFSAVTSSFLLSVKYYNIFCLSKCPIHNY